MNTTTMALRAPAPDDARPKAGWLERLASAFVASRRAQAERFVRPYLARLPDEELIQLGYSTAEIEALRAVRNASQLHCF